jgi:hypothetical protein
MKNTNIDITAFVTFNLKKAFKKIRWYFFYIPAEASLPTIFLGW